jgi:glycosyltransferase involved in cell wall biosynthesis
MVLPAVGVDTDVFSPRPPRERTPDAPFLLGYVGRLVEEKGLKTLLEAMARLCGPNAPAGEARLRLLMVGNGPQLPTLRETIRERGLGECVEIAPPVSPGEVVGVMRRLDALVLPSRTTPTWKEQFGRVLVEAMACGVPVIGSDSGAIPEVMGEAGLLFPEGDAVALAECVRRLMDDPALAAVLAQRGIQRATSCFSQAHLAEQTALFYRQVVSW